MNDFLKPKIKELAIEHKLTQSQILDIFYSQFKFAADVMREDADDEIDSRRSVKIRGFGTFVFNPKKALYMTNKTIEKNARKNMVKTSSQD